MKMSSVTLAVWVTVPLLLGAAPAFGGVSCEDFEVTVAWDTENATCSCRVAELVKTNGTFQWQEKPGGTKSATWKQATATADATPGHVEAYAKVYRSQFGWAVYGLWAKGYAEIQGTQTITWPGDPPAPSAQASASASGEWKYKAHADANGPDTAKAQVKGEATLETGTGDDEAFDGFKEFEAPDYDETPGYDGTGGEWVEVPWTLSTEPVSFEGTKTFHLHLAVAAYARFEDRQLAGLPEAEANSHVDGDFENPEITDP
jgi:hypothetical protein